MRRIHRISSSPPPIRRRCWISYPGLRCRDRIDFQNKAPKTIAAASFVFLMSNQRAWPAPINASHRGSAVLQGLHLVQPSRRQIVRIHPIARTALILSLMSFGFATASSAEPLLTQGIGTQNCGKLAGDLRPSEGLNHPPNYLLFYWVQGYVSAANIYLLNEYTDYVDMNDVEVSVILKLVYDFCRANPDKKPIAAIDQFIREANKVQADEKDAFDPWEH